MIKDLRNCEFPGEDPQLIEFIKENKDCKLKRIHENILLKFGVLISIGELRRIKRDQGLKKEKGNWKDGLDPEEALDE